MTKNCVATSGWQLRHETNSAHSFTTLMGNRENNHLSYLAVKDRLVGKRQPYVSNQVRFLLGKRFESCAVQPTLELSKKKMRSSQISYGESSFTYHSVEQDEYHTRVHRVATLVKNPHLAQIFNALATTWVEETGAYSITTRRYSHASYQAILSLGKEAVPFLLRELKERPDWWFDALTLLAKPQHNPVEPNSTFSEAVDAWIKWGQAKGLIE